MKLTLFTLTIVLCQTAIILTHSTVSSADGPLYYGFFFDADIATTIDNITQQYLRDTYAQIGDFKNFLNDLSIKANISDPLKYYLKPLDPNTGKYDPLYHITAKYCGENSTVCTTYEENVRQSIGQQFETQMIGLFFTNRTYGIRIQLSTSQEAIFDREPSRSNVAQFDSEYPGIKFIPATSKAHVTLGCGPGIPAVTTGTDLLEMLELEEKGTNCKTYTTMTNATVRQMGAECNIYVVYPTNKIVTDTTFRGYESLDDNNRGQSLSHLKWMWLLGPINLFLRRAY